MNKIKLNASIHFYYFYLIVISFLSYSVRYSPKKWKNGKMAHETLNVIIISCRNINNCFNTFIALIISLCIKTNIFQ